MKDHFLLPAIFLFLFATYSAPLYGATQPLPTLTRSLSYGMRNTEVSVLQMYLINLGLLQTNATGYFGRATQIAVRQLQTKHNLPVVGVVGPRTREIINNSLLSNVPLGQPTQDTSEQSPVTKNGVVSVPQQTQLDRKVTTDDIRIVTDIVNDIGLGYTTHNVDLITKHATDEATRIIQNKQITFPTVQTFAVQFVFPWGGHIVAESTTQTLSGVSDTVVLVFVRVNGVWKFDVSATLAYMESKRHPLKSVGDTNGFVDLVVVDAVVSPQRPLVNDPNTSIMITIKNKGTKISDVGAPFSATLDGFQSITPIQSGIYYPLAPGETAVWTFYPYKNNSLYHVSDIAGTKIVRVTLNNYRDLVESDYTNNEFTKTIEVYSN